MVCIARATQMFGLIGWVGLGLCALSILWFAGLWHVHKAELAALAIAPVREMPTPSQATTSVPPPRPALARQKEHALLLTQVQQVAVSQGLAWTAADYKLVPASESVPMALEIRCTLKGPYPRLRATLVQWLQGVPALAIRDLSMSRPSSDVLEVEAKLQIVIFMSSDATEAKP
jgi:hypothetical protein